MAQQRYTLVPPFSVRTFGIAGLVDACGAVLLGIGVAVDLRWMILVGAVVMFCGVGLMVAILQLRQRVTTTVLVGDDGIRITSGGRSASAGWSEISDATTVQQTIYLNRYENRPPLKIDSPRGSGDPQLAALSRELVARLDTSRGYHQL